MPFYNHILGFPRIGINRELKKFQENYWSGTINKLELLSIGKYLRNKHWKQQKEAGIDLLPVGDFAWYDHVLHTSMLLGNIPNRHKNIDGSIDIDTLFRIARGVAPTGNSTTASEMTKWFNTNYHYIVPELNNNCSFEYSWTQLIDEVDEALLLGYKIKPVLLGPISYLWLGKTTEKTFNKLELINRIIPIYQHVILELHKRKIDWVQIDEPILSLDLPNNWADSFKNVYTSLNQGVNILLTTYFGSVEHNFNHILNLPIQGIHIDIVSGNYDLNQINKIIPNDWLLSLGVINGRNIWRADLIHLYRKLIKMINIRPNIYISSSCSLLHCPIDVNLEQHLNQETKNWFSFALQKCHELFLLKTSLNNHDINLLEDWVKPLHSRETSKKVHKKNITERINNIQTNEFKRQHPFSIRSKIQKKYFNLPILPITSIGSLPQTINLRKMRSDFKNSYITFDEYNKGIKKYIKDCIAKQEILDLDVLVHGEPERNDMVEYFGEHLDGFVFTKNGWVQSYGSRCVKPPIIIGDISRNKPITIKWISYAQSLTNKPVKGMLTGPVTILCWSFPREDLSKSKIAMQIALALKDEVLDLENAGINIIQIDEPALREGLPLRKSKWNKYLSWATKSFCLSAASVKDSTQIHTHMCYCEFKDIMNAIIQLDVDVITLEATRSNLKLLKFFRDARYLNEIGPGIYDIHSPNIPTVDSIKKLLKTAIHYISPNRLWVNPDCGLKTRSWKEVEKSLQNMVTATKDIRKLIQ